MASVRCLRDKRTGNKYCIDGLANSLEKPESVSIRKDFSDCMTLQEDQLPPKVDLRSKMTPVEDQRQIPSW